jgi:hypothetical protein
MNVMSGTQLNSSKNMITTPDNNAENVNLKQSFSAKSGKPRQK